MESRIDRGLSRDQVRQDVSIHERQKVFEINGEDGQWVGKGQTGKGEIKKGIKRDLRYFRYFRYSKAFMGSFSRKGDAARKPKSRRTSGVCRERICSREKPGME